MRVLMKPLGWNKLCFLHTRPTRLLFNNLFKRYHVLSLCKKKKDSLLHECKEHICPSTLKHVRPPIIIVSKPILSYISINSDKKNPEGGITLNRKKILNFLRSNKETQHFLSKLTHNTASRFLRGKNRFGGSNNICLEEERDVKS